MMHEDMIKMGLNPRAPNPYYLLPRAEMDKIPQSYEESFEDLIGSRDDRRSQDINFYFQNGQIPDEYYEKIPPLAKAQFRIGDAFVLKLKDHAGRIKIAKEALKICVLCADAWSILAEHQCTTVKEALEMYTKAFEAGIESTGEPSLKKVFEGSDHSHQAETPMPMWQSLITRPILRAFQGIAICHLKLGNIDHARQKFHIMTFHVNPSDHQNMRANYIETLLILGKRHRDELKMLLDSYSDHSAHFEYTRALVSCLDNKKDEEVLKAAINGNKMVAEMLLKDTKVEFPPSSLMRSSPLEARAYVYLFAKHWKKAPGAMQWLYNVTLKVATAAVGNTTTTTSTPTTAAPTPIEKPPSSKGDDGIKLKLEGNNHWRENRFPQAIECYQKAIPLLKENKPELSACYLNQAMCYLKLSKLEECANSASQAIQIRPDYVKALHVRAKANYQRELLVPAYWDMVAVTTLDNSTEYEDFRNEVYENSMNDKLCGNCGKAKSDQVKLKQCAACRDIRYCSPTCQKQNWPVHKLYCEKLQE